MEIAGERWIVRVLGRAGSGGDLGAPLLLLGFWRSHEPADEPEREALVVGRTLAAQSMEELERALHASREVDRSLDSRRS